MQCFQRRSFIDIKRIVALPSATSIVDLPLDGPAHGVEPGFVGHLKWRSPEAALPIAGVDSIDILREMALNDSWVAGLERLVYPEMRDLGPGAELVAELVASPRYCKNFAVPRLEVHVVRVLSLTRN